MTQLMIALDYEHLSDAMSLVEQLTPEQCILKVGSEMFTRFGPSFVKSLVQNRFRIFLDLKFHDIPNTVARACAASADLGVWMLNIHASGGSAMMCAAQQALLPFGAQKPLLIAVTVLTSMSQDTIPELGLVENMDTHVLRLASLAKNAGVDGVVCSALEVPSIKKTCGPDFLTVSPGVRLQASSRDDQARVVTVKQALALGCDYVVMGRPITQADDPLSVTNHILSILRAENA